MHRTRLVADNLSLHDAVDLSVLQRIQDTFANAMGFAAVTVDKSGAPITRDSSFLRICRMIRATDAGFARCKQCDAEGGLQAQAIRGPHIYQCKGGLVDIAAPIVIQGEYLGCILCGQVIPSAAREEHIEEIVRRNSSLGLPRDELRLAAQEIPSIPHPRVEAAAEMLFLVANYIVEMGVATLTEVRLHEETQRRSALQVELQNAQLRALESQINPHFLFNALGLISYSAIREKAPQTEEIAYCLSDLLRYSLRNATNAVTLSKELETIERYLAIQKLRFGSRLSYQIDVDPSLLQASIPCMILQPLVENAIVHGIERATQPVTVQVRASRVPAGMRLEVVDDGFGMEAVVMASINSRASSTGPSSVPRGMQNVIRRLEVEYGTGFDIHVESELGRGTQIRLTLPLADALQP